MFITLASHRPALVAASLVAAATLAGCSAAADPGPAGDASAAGWSYTDDTGTTVTLDAAPERVASFTDYAVGLLSYGVDPVAVFGRVDVASDPRFAADDLADVAIVGNSYGEIDIEALAAARPELIVTGIYPEDSAGTVDLDGPYYGVADVEQQEQLEAIAPVVAIKIGGAGSEVIDSVNRLALALGAEQDTIDAAKAEFDAAAADLSAAAAESPLEVTQMYAGADGIYVAKPADEPEMDLYATYGVRWTDLNPGVNYYWDIYSWENASQMMTGDVLLVNVEGYQLAELSAQPTFASHPAVLAGQVVSWNQAAMDYGSQAEHMTQLAEVLRAAQPV